MNSEQLENIFLPFEQVGDIHQRADGTGLGLAISRQLVKLMGSEIEVKSKLGQGSTFWFDLEVPYVEVETVEEQFLIKRIIGYTGGRVKVLVVDDDEDSRNVLRKMMESLGFEVALMKDGLETINHVEKVKADIIFMNVVMPGKTGFETVAEIRQMPAFREIPIIMVSANIHEISQGNGRFVGHNGFLSKPVKEDELLNILTEHMEIEWTYNKDSTVEDEIADSTLIPPPIEDVAILHELATLGLMQDVAKKATQLESLDEQYIPFLRKVKGLAEALEDEQILALLEQSLVNINKPVSEQSK
jgi:CheY-like chemotaxis protein